MIVSAKYRFTGMPGKGERPPGDFFPQPLLAAGPAKKTWPSGQTYSRLLARFQEKGGGKKAAEGVLNGKMRKETLAAFLRGSKLLSAALLAAPAQRQEILTNLADISTAILAGHAKQGKGWGDAAADDALLSTISSFHRRLRDTRMQSKGVQNANVAGKE